MIDSRKLLLFTIGILFGAAIGVGTYDLLTNQQQLSETNQYQEQIQTLNGIIEEKEANITQLEQDKQALQEDIRQLQEQIALQTQHDDPQETENGSTDITIFHINDLHGRLQSQDPNDGMVGGIAKIAYIINQERETGANVIFLAAGDIIYGTILTDYYEGIPTVESLNAADLDAMVVGNHEFDFGLEIMSEAWSASTYPWLHSNLYETSTGTDPEYLEQYLIMEVGGIDVALFGLFGANVDDIANSLLPQMDTESDLIIALTHIGYSSDIDLAQNTDGIDVIVGGHSHTRLDDPAYTDGTIIVQAWNHGLVLGRLDITVDDDEVIAYSGELIPITEEIPDDPSVAAAIQPYVDEYGPIMDRVVGRSLVDLNAEAGALRGRDTNAGNLVADAMLWQAGDADIAITNSGGFRWKRVFPAGEITRADVHELLPFPNSLVVAEFTGEQIRQELEYCTDGAWIQVSGIRFTYDPSLPANERVIEVYVGDEPLDANRVYKVALHSYLREGGAGHWLLTQGQNYVDHGIFLDDCLINYLEEFSPVSPTADGRITPIQ